MSEPDRVMQTITDGPDANCMNACLASYFRCPISETPELHAATWTQEIREWVRPKGYGYVTIAVPTELVFTETFSDGYLIVSGTAKRGRLHAVIYKDGALWHDPHPDSSGVDRVDAVDFFYPLEPS